MLGQQKARRKSGLGRFVDSNLHLVSFKLLTIEQGTGFGDSNASIATIDHDLHRVRRSAFASYFSKASISAREPTIQATVYRLIHRLEKYQATGQPVDLTHAYTALTCDIISKFCFGEPYNLCEAPDFGRQLHDAMVSSIRMAPLIVQFPWILTILNSLPLWLAKRLSPEASTLLQMQADWANQVQAVLAEPSSATTDKNIFHAILDADIPEAEKSTKRLNSEAQVMIGAGTLTTSHTLATTTYYLLANPPTLTRLISELDAANADLSQPLSLAELEQIPYLTAVMFEGLRISYGVSHRLQRIARDRTIKYHDWIIPVGTPVGLTAVHIHDDPDIFPSPREFRPERWLPLETTGLRLQEYLVSFSKGTRNCAGMNLAYAEFRVALAAVIRRFGGQMKLWDVVKERDVDAVTDAFAPLPTKAGRGIRVVL